MENTEAQAIAELAREGARQVAVVQHQGRSFLAKPEGYEINEITDQHGLKTQVPHRITSAPQLLDRQSLIDYVKTFKGEGTIILADYDTDTFLALLDYHLARQPAFVDHRATLKLQRSEEWKRWTAIDGKMMPQDDFASFLEENAADVTQPQGADLLELAKDLSARRSVHWKRAIRLDNGDEEFEYQEQTDAQSKSGTIEVPRSFVLTIPVYFGEPQVNITAWLRWKLTGGTLQMGLQMHRPVYVQKAVLNVMATEIREATGCPVWMGKTAI